MNLFSLLLCNLININASVCIVYVRAWQRAVLPSIGVYIASNANLSSKRYAIASLSKYLRLTSQIINTDIVHNNINMLNFFHAFFKFILFSIYPMACKITIANPFASLLPGSPQWRMQYYHARTILPGCPQRRTQYYHARDCLNV